jgi:hypothetical protein
MAGKGRDCIGNIFGTDRWRIFGSSTEQDQRDGSQKERRHANGSGDHYE